MSRVPQMVDNKLPDRVGSAVVPGDDGVLHGEDLVVGDVLHPIRVRADVSKVVECLVVRRLPGPAQPGFALPVCVRESVEPPDRGVAL